VVSAAKLALDSNNVKLILPWVQKDAEEELSNAFSKVSNLRKKGKEEKEIADYWFFETAVRLHRRGEGEAFTGLKPAGLDWGPVVPKADKAIETGDPNDVIALILETAEKELKSRFEYAMLKKAYDKNDVDKARDYIHSMLEFVLFSHHLYKFITSEEHHGD
jgi:hypothetical protein